MNMFTSFLFVSTLIGVDHDPSETLERVRNSVVVVETLDRLGETLGHGSGFAVAKGIIVTNVHVVEDGSRFRIIRSDGQSIVGTGFWAFDEKHDLALLQLSDPEKLGDIPTLTLADDKSVRVGLPIYVIGHPKNLKYTVSRGIISAVGRRLNEIDPTFPKVEVIQTDAATAGGSSGGPWVNAAGEVVGVHQAGMKIQGFNFATHVEHLRPLMARERKKMLPLDHFVSAERTEALTVKPKAFPKPPSWRVIVPPSTKPKDKILFSPVKTLEFNGIGGDRNNLHKFKVDGNWELSGTTLQRTGGPNAAVSFGVTKDFEFEGRVDYGNEGGSFFLLGWKDRSGYLIQEVGLRKSANWVLSEVREGSNIPSTHRHLSGAKVRGDCPMVISVSDKKLKLAVSTHTIANDVELPNYVEGDFIIGSYPCQYGPRPLRILSARTRTD